MKRRNYLGWLSIAFPLVGIPIAMLAYSVAGHGNRLLIGESGFYVLVWLAAAGAVCGLGGLMHGRAAGKPMALSVFGLVLGITLIAAPAILSVLLVSH